MIRRWMKELPERALWRIVEAPSEKWIDGSYSSGDSRCLVGHAAAHGTNQQEDGIWAHRFRTREREMFGCSLAVDHRFDAIVVRVGLDRARRLCQNAAMKEILSRSGVRVTHNYARLAEHAVEPDASRERDPGLEWDRDPTPYAEAEEAYRREPW